MTHAAPPPVSRDEIAVALRCAYWQKPEMEAIPCDKPGWFRMAELVQTWIAYERDLTRYVIDSKLIAERERAIEEVAQCCDAIAEQARPHHDPIGTARLCAASARSLKVVP